MPFDGVAARTIAEGVSTVALVTVFDTGVRESGGGAEVGAHSGGHVGGDGGSTGESAAVGTLSRASDLSPSGGERSFHRDETGVGHRGVAGGLGTSTNPERVAAGELGERCLETDGLVGDLHLGLACSGISLNDVRSENTADCGCKVTVISCER